MSDEFQLVSLIVPGASLIVTAVFGGFTVRFSKDQASIAKTQAETASTQAKTARNKLKFDLFEKRLAIYTAVGKLLGRIAVNADVTDQELAEFCRDTVNAKWLLNEEVSEYFFEEIHKKAVELQTSVILMKDLPVGPERSKCVEKQRAIKEGFIEKRKAIDEMMVPFLKLEDS